MLDLVFRHRNARQMGDAPDGYGINGHSMFLRRVWAFPPASL
jgi:hypothetical protein